MGIIFGLMDLLESVEINVLHAGLIHQARFQLRFALLAELDSDLKMGFVKSAQLIVTNAQIIDAMFAEMDITQQILDHVPSVQITVYSA